MLRTTPRSRTALLPTLMIALAPACAEPCADDGLRQRCDAVPLVSGSSSGAGPDTTGDAGGSDGSAPGTSSSGGADASGDSTGVGVLATGSSDGSSSDGSSSDGGDGSSSEGGLPREPVDLSGWSVVQTQSDRVLVLPEGTIVARGGTVVIARDASREAFEAFWGVVLGDDVVYVQADDVLPVCNGDETFALVAADATVVDGPSPPLQAGTLLSRIDASLPGDDPDAWALGDPLVDATPGTVALVGASPGEPRVSEVVDPADVGAFVYEYVELYVGA
ncbi:MAG: hypothetical protein U0168_25825 [Nannocystaceae bacterium]